MAKIYCVIQKNWISYFKKMSIWSLTYQQSLFKRYHSDKHFSEFLPTRWRQKSTGTDMEQNYYFPRKFENGGRTSLLRLSPGAENPKSLHWQA